MQPHEEKEVEMQRGSKTYLLGGIESVSVFSPKGKDLTQGKRQGSRERSSASGRIGNS